MAFTIKWSERAFKSLEGNFEYIARDSLKYAKIFVRDIRSQINALKETPILGRQVPEMHNQNYREIIYKSYRIIYRVDTESNFIQILLIRHGAKPIEADFLS